MKTIEFIGGGRITKIMLQAFKNQNISFDRVTVFDINEEALKSINTMFPKVQTFSNFESIANSELVIISVHPPIMMETLEKLKGKLKQGSVLISFAPKFSINKIATIIGGYDNIARMNPSASTIVNKGVNPISFSATFDQAKKIEIFDLFKNIGISNEIEDNKIEAYAVISAMGHTYFNFQIQKLKELAITFGMDETEAQSIIANMLLGTTETLFNSGLNYTEVVDLVPVKPMAEVEETIKGFYDQYLTGIYNKILP